MFSFRLRYETAKLWETTLHSKEQTYDTTDLLFLLFIVLSVEKFHMYLKSLRKSFHCLSVRTIIFLFVIYLKEGKPLIDML